MESLMLSNSVIGSLSDRTPASLEVWKDWPLWLRMDKMEAEKKSRWADSDSEEDIEHPSEHVITSLGPADPSPDHTTVTKRRKKKKHQSDSEEEAPSDPSLVTRIVQAAPTAPPKHLREDGTAASRREIKKKEIEELDDILQQLGVSEEAKQATEAAKQATEAAKEEGKAQSAGKPKGGKGTSKKEIFTNVLAESTARAEKSKKGKKRDKFADAPRDT